MQCNLKISFLRPNDGAAPYRPLLDEVPCGRGLGICSYLATNRTYTEDERVLCCPGHSEGVYGSGYVCVFWEMYCDHLEL